MQGLRDHESHDLADVVNLVADNWKVGRRKRRLAIGLSETRNRMILGLHRHGAVRDALQSIGCVIGTGQHQHYPRCFFRLCYIDAFQPRMRVIGAQRISINLPIRTHIVGVLPFAGQKSEILAARNVRAYSLNHHLDPHYV